MLLHEFFQTAGNAISVIEVFGDAFWQLRDGLHVIFEEQFIPCVEFGEVECNDDFVQVWVTFGEFDGLGSESFLQEFIDGQHPFAGFCDEFFMSSGDIHEFGFVHTERADEQILDVFDECGNFFDGHGSTKNM